jgi:hypothetical protein
VTLLYLIANMKFLKANRAFTAVRRNSFQPEFWKFLNQCLNCFSLHKKKRTPQNSKMHSSFKEKFDSNLMLA